MWKIAILWTMTAVLVGFYLLAGATKLGSHPAQPSNFVRWGYPFWFQYVVGVVELGGALLLLVPRVAAVGVLLLGLTMIGAALTHVVHGEMEAVPVPLALLLFLAVIGYTRWKSAWTWVHRI
ncbi:MAG: DoxX family protein, partial [Nitrospirales bacterium]